jgi:hypothetical protein
MHHGRRKGRIAMHACGSRNQSDFVDTEPLHGDRVRDD